MEIDSYLNFSFDSGDDLFQIFDNTDSLLEYINEHSSESEDKSNQLVMKRSKPKQNKVSKSIQNQSNGNEVIEKPLPTSTMFCIGLSHAFNSGDTDKIAYLTAKFTHSRVLFRYKNHKFQYHAVGPDKIMNHFKNTLNNFPDAIMFVKKVIPSKKFGHRVLITKYYFSGNKLFNNKRESNTIGIHGSEKVVFKGVAVCYLDHNNRVVVIDDTVRPILNDRFLKN